MGNWDGMNRRRFPRVSYPCLVVIRTKEKDVNDYILTHTENLGIGGVCVIIKQSIKMFCPVELELDLMDLREHIKCKGKVVWNVRRRMNEKNKPLFYDIGIEFDDLNKTDLERIRGILNQIMVNSHAKKNRLDD